MARILLAEDDESLRRYIARLLEKNGHDVCTASDGSEAMGMLTGVAFDLLLTDLVMPGVDGMELARFVADLYPETSIMFITGFSAVPIRQAQKLDSHRAVQDARVLSKPFHLKDIVEAVE